MLLTVAMFKALSRHFELDWEISWQGINVADHASKAGGDITIRNRGAIILAVEVTERQLDKHRVAATFHSKISPQGIEDYLFFFSTIRPTEDARAVAQQYFAQGHDISFLPVKDWPVNCLGIVGGTGRSAFTNEFLMLLGTRDVPATLKVAWNDQVQLLLD